MTRPADPDSLPLEDDPEFQPVTRPRMHWLTIVLLGLVIWAAGFLTGVLADRAMASMLGG